MQASDFVLCGLNNVWIEWKSKDIKIPDEVYRKN